MEWGLVFGGLEEGDAKFTLNLSLFVLLVSSVLQGLIRISPADTRALTVLR